MCREIRTIKNQYQYDFSNLLVDLENDSLREKNEKNLKIEDIADYFTEEIINKNKDIERIKDYPYAQPIIAISNHLGFKNYESDFSLLGKTMDAYRNSSGMIAIDGDLIEKYDTDKILIINKNDTTKHQRFTIAHELGHYLFDFNETKDYKYYDFYRTENIYINATERRASRFAAALLMPRNTFIERYNKIKNTSNYYETINRLSNEFQVSPTAIDRRIKELKELGVLQDGQ